MPAQKAQLHGQIDDSECCPASPNLLADDMEALHALFTPDKRSISN